MYTCMLISFLEHPLGTTHPFNVYERGGQRDKFIEQPPAHNDHLEVPPMSLAITYIQRLSWATKHIYLSSEAVLVVFGYFSAVWLLVVFGYFSAL